MMLNPLNSSNLEQLSLKGLYPTHSVSNSIQFDSFWDAVLCIVYVSLEHLSFMFAVTHVKVQSTVLNGFCDAVLHRKLTNN